MYRSTSKLLFVWLLAFQCNTFFCYLVNANTPSKTLSAYDTKYREAKRLANINTVTVISSGGLGTDMKVTSDIANVFYNSRDKGLRVIPFVGYGGLQNIKDILFLKGVDMGVVHPEHLTYLKNEDPILYKDIQNQVRYITKLYNSEWHLLAHKSIKSIEDLKGKTVNMWRRDSTTDISSRVIFNTVGVEVKAAYMDPQIAIQKVQSGEIAATAIMQGAPFKGYEGIGENDNLHFLPINLLKHSKLLEVFLPAQITSDNYPNIISKGDTVRTVASSAVLAAYNWPKGSFRYKKLQRFVEHFFNQINKLKKYPFHSKWKNINLSACVSGWKRFRPASNHLSVVTASNTSEVSQLKKEFQGFLKEKLFNNKWKELSLKERQSIFREFLLLMEQSQKGSDDPSH